MQKVATHLANLRQAQPRTRSVTDNLPALEYATRLIYQVCCFAGSFNLIEEWRDKQLCAAIEKRDNAVLFNRLTVDFSFQGISNETAANYMRRHGRATWRSVRKNLVARPTCPKLQTYWHFHDCRYEKTRFFCAEPNHIDTCPLPNHRLRNGHLNQIAYSLFLFIRDIADGDLITWIDDRLNQATEEGVADPLEQARNALIEPLRNVYGISDKVLAIGLSSILIGAADVRPKWLTVGVQLIAIDTLVHNFLHRTGILQRFEAAHAYGADCYRPGGCADIIRAVARRIDARQFNHAFPRVFPRFVQLAIWRYCGQDAFDICNGNRLDDRKRCQNRHCRLYGICGRIRLK
jgi:hypothetical protein